MKKAGFFSILLFLFFLIFPKQSSYAQDIKTGDQTAQTRVINKVDNGSVTSRIETTVNGKTTTVDSNEPGEIKVTNNNGKVVITKSAETSITVSPTRLATVTPSIKPQERRRTFISNLFENLSNFFKRIFHNL